MTQSYVSKQVVVYIVKQHPLERPDEGRLFQWLHHDNDLRRQLEGIIGPFDPHALTLLIDDFPAGEAWNTLLEDLIQERIASVVTHLAPLSAAQRQQLIGVCAQVGAQLITPGDAGRNRLSENHKKPE
ncbi:MAG: hypothetical protein P1P76_05770 [Anaerolineales bacterium]|nr:hypothetical protein [Anaerolineales bacterium]